MQTLVKYAIHLLDLSRPGGVWEQRGQYIYYTEFATDSLVLAGTLGMRFVSYQQQQNAK